MHCTSLTFHLQSTPPTRTSSSSSGTRTQESYFLPLTYPLHDNKRRKPPRANAGPNDEITTKTLQIGHKFNKQPRSNEPDQLNCHPWRGTTTSSTTTLWQAGGTLLCPCLTPPLPHEEPSLNLKSRSCQMVLKKHQSRNHLACQANQPCWHGGHKAHCSLCAVEQMVISHNFYSSRKKHLINLKSELCGVCSCKTRFLQFAGFVQEGGLWWGWGKSKAELLW